MGYDFQIDLWKWRCVKIVRVRFCRKVKNLAKRGIGTLLKLLRMLNIYPAISRRAGSNKTEPEVKGLYLVSVRTLNGAFNRFFKNT